MSRLDYGRKYYATESGRAKARAGVARYHQSEKGKRQLAGQVLRKYGMTLEDYSALLERQGGTCALCAATHSHGRARLSVDHCHETGVVRGLLCMLCNRKIGQFNDDPEKLRAAIRYLERPGSKYELS